MSDKKLKMLVALFFTVLTTIAFVGSSYAWISLSTAPIVSDLLLNVVSNTDLMIAFDVDGEPGEWGSILNFSELPEGSVLKPITFSASRGIFLAPRYGWDGRTDFSDPIPLTDEFGNLLETVDSSVAADAEGSSPEYGILRFDLWFYTGAADCTVSFTHAAKREEHGEMGSGTFVIGEPIWNEETLCHEESGKGAEYAVRFAFVIHPYEKDGAYEIVLYEPNCDGGRGGCEAYEVETENEDGTTETAILDYLITASSDEAGGALEGTYKIIRQRSSAFADKDPALIDEVEYSEGAFIDEDVSLFDLRVEEPRKVTMFVWLEGQDADCNNAVSGGAILANLQFMGSMGYEHEDLHPE